MRSTILLTFCSLLFLYQVSYCQINFTANDIVPDYESPFNMGAGIGYYGQNWKDEEQADILATNEAEGVGLGCNSLRLSLSDNLITKYSQWMFRQPAFEHYGTIGCKNNTLFIGEPHETNREQIEHCPGERSKMFIKMYEPIWDNGENGTPINDENVFAVYVYHLATNYPNIRFWEVINEPDFTYGTRAAFSKPGEPDNWWDNDPPPCSLVKMYAPIQYYVRALRISYEVIKSVKPNDYICVGGIGYASFLDAILRNTDNPDGGDVTSDFPLKGGAYFDCLSFHVYPQFYLRTWNNDKKDFDYFRHSDAAVNVIEQYKNDFEKVLSAYGYNGIEFPAKRAILTETNIPDRPFENYIGSDEAQRNFVMKAVLKTQMLGLDAIYIFTSADSKKEDDITTPYQTMGLYKNITDQVPYQQQIKSSGIGYKNINYFIQNRLFDKEKTKEMGLNNNIDGGAFVNDQGQYVYALWAKTNLDKEETVSATYQFPQYWDFRSLIQYNWDYTESKDSTLYNAEDLINLYGYPTFFVTNEDVIQNETGDIVKVSQIITPNGDGSNDFLEIKEFWKLKNAKLYIFDYKGALVYQAKKYDNNWPTQNLTNNTLPNGAYYYTIEFDDTGQKQNGAFRLMR